MTAKFGIPIVLVLVGVVAFQLYRVGDPDGQPSNSESFSTLRPTVAPTSPVNRNAEIDFSEPRDRNRIVGFPNGQTFIFRLHKTPTKPGRPTVNFSEFYSNLEQLANSGSSDAAYILYSGVSTCQHALLNESSVDDAMHELNTTGSVTVETAVGNVTHTSGSNNDLLREHMIDDGRFCHGITVDQRRTAEEWLYLAADNGNQNAQFDLGQMLLNRSDPAAEAYLKQSWENGSLEAAAHLEYFYTRGAPEEYRDPIKAYAYAYIHRSISQQMLENRSRDTIDPRALAENQRYLQRASYELSASDIPQALELAQELMGAATKCCYSLYAR